MTAGDVTVTTCALGHRHNHRRVHGPTEPVLDGAGTVLLDTPTAAEQVHVLDL